jgi:hypothetical protein
MADWDESEHPRDQAGRFRDKAGAWAGRVADQMSRGLWTGRVRRDDALIDVSDLGPQALESLRHPFAYGDPMLAEIYRRQGFDGPPRVVSREEMDRLVADGEVVEVWRGVEGTAEMVSDNSGSRTIRTSGAELAERYRTGPYYAGKGARGNGTYTTTDRALAENAYSEGGSSLLRIGLATDARVVDWKEFETEVERYQPDADRFKHAWLFGSQDDATFLGRIMADAGPETIQAWVLLDEGRLAAARGIDAIRVRRAGGRDYYVILNRTATVVQEA